MVAASQMKYYGHIYVSFSEVSIHVSPEIFYRQKHQQNLGVKENEYVKIKMRTIKKIAKYI